MLNSRNGGRLGIACIGIACIAHSRRDLLLLEDSDMETFGVTNKFHRKCIMTAVTALKLRQNPDQPGL